MQRLSVSVDDELAEWVGSQANERGVSRAKVVRDAIETARVTGLVDPGDEGRTQEGEILDRLEDIEARVSALEQASTGLIDDRSEDAMGVRWAFRLVSHPKLAHTVTPDKVLHLVVQARIHTRNPATETVAGQRLLSNPAIDSSFCRTLHSFICRTKVPGS